MIAAAAAPVAFAAVAGEVGRKSPMQKQQRVRNKYKEEVISIIWTQTRRMQF